MEFSGPLGRCSAGRLRLGLELVRKHASTAAAAAAAVGSAGVAVKRSAATFDAAARSTTDAAWVPLKSFSHCFGVRSWTAVISAADQLGQHSVSMISQIVALRVLNHYVPLVF